MKNDAPYKEDISISNVISKYMSDPFSSYNIMY